MYVGQDDKKKTENFEITARCNTKKIDDKVIQLWEEKFLLSRFLVTSRKGQEVDLEHCLGNVEFCRSRITFQIRWRSYCVV